MSQSFKTLASRRGMLRACSPPMATFMIQALADQVWHAAHDFRVNGVAVRARMTIVRLPGGGLWLHSPVPLSADQRAAIDRLGPVRCIVAPSKTHHLFVADSVRAWPGALVFGAPGLRAKRPDLPMLQEIPMGADAPWGDALQPLLFEGIPFANETVWWHPSSRTLILCDLLQCHAGALPWSARLYARLTGVRDRLAVPSTVRWLLRDRDAARRSAARLLDWPFERLVVAHHAVIEADAHAQARRALQAWLGALPPARAAGT